MASTRFEQRLGLLTFPVGAVVTENFTTKLDPFRSHVGENNVLIDKDSVGNSEISM